MRLHVNAAWWKHLLSCFYIVRRTCMGCLLLSCLCFFLVSNQSQYAGNKRRINIYLVVLIKLPLIINMDK